MRLSPGGHPIRASGRFNLPGSRRFGDPAPSGFSWNCSGPLSNKRKLRWRIPFKDTKSYVPNARFNGGVGKQLNSLSGARHQRIKRPRRELWDADNLRDPSYVNEPRKDWRSGGGKGQAEGKPGFDYYQKSERK